MMRTPFHHPAKNMQDKSIFLMERKGGGKKKTQKAFSILYFQILIRGSNYHLYI
jgi:hypothetical protein